MCEVGFLAWEERDKVCVQMHKPIQPKKWGFVLNQNAQMAKSFRRFTFPGTFYNTWVE